MERFFIEITRMSGVKTYLGWEMEEFFYPEFNLKREWGFKTQDEAERNISDAVRMMDNMGTKCTSFKVIKI